MGEEKEEELEIHFYQRYSLGLTYLLVIAIPESAPLMVGKTISFAEREMKILKGTIH